MSHFLSQSLFYLEPYAALIVGVVGLFGVRYSTANIYRRRRAEREFRHKLALEESYKNLLLSRERLRSSLEQRGATPEELKEADVELWQTLNEVLMDLDEDSRERILEALNQPSAKGRRNYVSKLIKETSQEAKELEEPHT